MGWMRREGTAALAALAAAAALTGCGGSSTKTVSVASEPQQSSSTATSTATGTTGTSTQSTTTGTQPPASTAGGSAAPEGSTTRTAPEPQFAEGEARGEGAGAAEAVLREHGYTPVEASQYHAQQTLRVLVGANGGAQQAFFFVDGRYIGTDTKQPSASVKVLSQGDTEVTLGYGLYRGEQTAGQATVRFALNDGKLTALDPIPPASSASAPSRR
jgi:LppP/LprE lipoprotein